MNSLLIENLFEVNLEMKRGQMSEWIQKCKKTNQKYKLMQEIQSCNDCEAFWISFKNFFFEKPSFKILIL